MSDVLRFEYYKGVKSVRPCAPLASSMSFNGGEEDEAVLANSIAIVAEKNGLSMNDVHYVFPYILRMLKSKTRWSGNPE